MKKALFITLLLNSGICLMAQTFNNPNYALKSHETLIISKIEVNRENTLIYLSIENRITGGNFCADKNITLSYPTGEKMKLIRAEGIPVCPDSYNFKRIGEKLDFRLTFPKLKEGTEWIDIVEECSDNCFSFYGVVLNEALNQKIDEAVNLAQKGESLNSIAKYQTILQEIQGKNIGIEGAIYSDLITLLMNTGKTVEARKWYDKMVSSKAPRLEMHLKNLKSRGIGF